MIIVYNKLIRDKIPQIIKASGKQAKIRVLDEDEYVKKLDLKLQEELEEYIHADENEKIEELADLVELVYAILENKGVSTSDFEEVRLNKREKRGGFQKRLFLHSVGEDMEQYFITSEYKGNNLTCASCKCNSKEEDMIEDMIKTDLFGEVRVPEYYCGPCFRKKIRKRNEEDSSFHCETCGHVLVPDFDYEDGMVWHFCPNADPDDWTGEESHFNSNECIFQPKEPWHSF